MAKSFALAGAAAGAFAIKVGLDGVKSASDLNEEVSKAEVIFGDVSMRSRPLPRQPIRPWDLRRPRH
jgi:hypothetical protein